MRIGTVIATLVKIHKRITLSANLTKPRLNSHRQLWCACEASLGDLWNFHQVWIYTVPISWGSCERPRTLLRGDFEFSFASKLKLTPQRKKIPLYSLTAFDTVHCCVPWFVWSITKRTVILYGEVSPALTTCSVCEWSNFPLASVSKGTIKRAPKMCSLSCDIVAKRVQ